MTAKMFEERKVKAYMRREIADHVDLDTGEVDCATLATDAMDNFITGNLDAQDVDTVFDWAFEVVEAYEAADKQTEKRVNRRGAFLFESNEFNEQHEAACQLADRITARIESLSARIARTSPARKLPGRFVVAEKTY